MKLYLTLANGQIFEGEGFGAECNVLGEVVFTTGMVGYLETLTDPSYHGQIVVQTFPLIGNYGIIPDDFESDMIGPSAYIVRDWCDFPSNFRSDGNIHTFLKEKGIVGLSGVDTRAITKIIREHGTMNGIISTKPATNLEEIKAFTIINAVENTTCKTPYIVGENGKVNIALMDYGAKRNISRELAKRGAKVTVFPASTPASEVLATNPDGIMLSNGAGDPAENVKIIEEIKVLSKSGIPIFGICLGHQLLALAHGFETHKMKYGHRGGNQPVKNLQNGKTYITSQNHGYAVKADTVDENIAEPLFINVNDGTNEGLWYKNSPIFSAQFHPEACNGPLDTRFLFDTFFELIGTNKEQ